MATPLEKARQDPNSMKGRILDAARRLFGKYGFHGTTTRMIAKNVGIDISTLYYHWGEKGDLYEAVVLDINEGMRVKLLKLEKTIKNRPLGERLQIAIDEMVDYLFERPEISNLTIFRYFTKMRHKSTFDKRVPEFISDIAFSMGLTKDRSKCSAEAKMKVLTIINSIHNYVSGESFFLPMLDIEKKDYIRLAKETIKFYAISAFSESENHQA